MLALGNGVVMTGFMMLLPLLPRYISQLSFNDFQIGILVASFFAGRVLFEFPVGIVSDYIGRRLVMWAALSLSAVATAAYALTTTPELMMFFRLLQGVAASAFVVGSQAYINDCTPMELRGLANGINSSAINIGVIVGPLLAGFLSQAYSIGTPFWIGGALAAVCLFLSLRIPEVSFSQAPGKPPRPDRYFLKELLAPVISRRSFALSMIHFLQWMGITIFLTMAPILTAEKLGWGVGLVAVALAASGAVSAISSPTLGQLSDRQGRIGVMMTGLIIMGLESLAVLFHPGTALTIAAFAVGGLGAPAYFNSFLSLIGDVTRPFERGAVTGFIGSFGEWGSIIGSAVAAPLLWHAISTEAPMAFDAVVFFASVLLVLASRALLRAPAEPL